MTWWKKMLIGFVVLCLLLTGFIFWLAQKPKPNHIIYGMSFNAEYATELGLNWKEVYAAVLNDLKVRHLRLSATWSTIEPQPGVYDFTALDYQITKAQAAHADVILAVGRRTPRWPECHTPNWAQHMTWDQQKQATLQYITTVVNHYKNSPAITYWQIENEPFLQLYASSQCGTFDSAFFKQEVTLFHSLDATRPFLVTDSGNLGTWFGAYGSGDAFGTSVYVYFWNPQIGQFTTFLPPWFYRVKDNLMGLLYGHKESMLIELSAEPWLLGPIENTSVAVQKSRMDLQKFNSILDYAAQTRFEKQYLWGGEWWYYLKQKGENDMWDRGKQLFAATTTPN